jgi:hypothetical protein
MCNITMRCLCIFILLLSCIGCSPSDEEWKGSIEVVDGVRVVRNPANPLYGDFHLNLNEVLSIGSEEDPDYLFYRAADILLDEDGCIYVVDSGNSRIQKFRGDGRYLHTYGKKGQGPGEFASFPRKIFIDGEKTLHVLEYRKISSFSAEGEFMQSFPVNTNVWDFAVDKGGGLLGAADLISRDPAHSALVKIDRQGNIFEKLAEYETAGVKIIVGRGLTYTVSKRHAYAPRLVFSSFEGDAYCYAFGTEYVLFVIDSTGTILRRIHRDIAPLDISTAEKDAIIDGAAASLERNNIPVPREKVRDILTFGKSRAFFDKILQDDEGRIYVPGYGMGHLWQRRPLSLPNDPPLQPGNHRPWIPL